MKIQKAFYPLSVILLLSCTEEQIMLTEQAETPLNTLEFADTQEINAYVNAVHSSQNENGARTISTTFESFDKVYKEALAKLDLAETIEQHDLILEEYSDVIHVEDSTYVPKIKNLFYRKICNRGGLYISDGFAHKVIGDEAIVYTRKANIEALAAVKSVENLDETKFISTRYQETTTDPSNGRMLAACGAPEMATYYKNPSGCNDDRKVTTYINPFWIVSGNDRTPAALSQVYGQLRTGVWCNWKNYETRLEHVNVSFTITYGTTLGTADVIMNRPDYIGTNDVERYESWNGALIGGPMNWNGYSPLVIYTKEAHQEGTSRGVGTDNWAILDCE